MTIRHIIVNGVCTICGEFEDFLRETLKPGDVLDYAEEITLLSPPID